MTLEPIVVTGDLIHLNEEQREWFYIQNCDAMGLDFRTRPLQYFEQLDRNGKRNLILYALRNASTQLRAKHKLTLKLSAPIFENDTVIFTATAHGIDGEEDSAVGAVSLRGLGGKAYADGIMAAQTKAKRRAILDFVGFALLDESEIEGMNGSTVELPNLEAYEALPAAPEPVTAGAATEVLPVEVAKQLSSDPPAVAAIIVEGIKKEVAEGIKKEVAEAFTLEPTMPSEQEVTFRLNTYKRDILQRGGMKPSKGFGIQAKWSKFVTKHAPNKTIEEYLMLLGILDKFLQHGEKNVVDYIEQEIAA